MQNMKAGIDGDDDNDDDSGGAHDAKASSDSLGVGTDDVHVSTLDLIK